MTPIQRICGVIAFFFGSLLIAMMPLAFAAEQVEVSVEGVSGEVLKNVLVNLSIEQQKNAPGLTEALVRRLHARAPGEIRLALQPFGYYRPEISAELARKDEGWLAGYRVDPGEPVRITDIDLLLSGEGSEALPFRALREDFPLKQGEALDHGKYERAKRLLLETAVEEGYLDARFTVHEVVVDPDALSARVALRFDTGPLYRFGDVAFEQEPWTLDQDFLERFIPFRRGDPYRAPVLLEFQAALTTGDRFSRVEVRPLREAATDLHVPIEVKLAPRQRQRYSLGAGYGTDTGLRGVLGWENRRLNPRGHRLGAEARLSEVKSSFSTRYLVPMRRPATDYLDYTAGISDEKTRVSESRVLALGSSFHHQIGRFWSETWYLSFQEEKFTVGGETGRARLILPGANWLRLKADDRIATAHGSSLLLDARGSGSALGSDTSFVQLRVKGKLVRSPWDGGRIIARTDLGFSRVAEFSELPVSQRFFAGGDRSVRGYAYQSLGPTDDQGRVVGGRNLIVGSLEYEHRVYEKWSAAVFYDAGNAVDDLPDPLKQGAGFGVRWMSPVGPFRLDFARTVHEPRDTWRIHLSIGPDL